MNWLSKLAASLFGRQEKQRRDSQSAQDAKRYLDSFRENELSVGAAMRRGETVDRAPGQLRHIDASSKELYTEQSSARRKTSGTSEAKSEGDFSTSLAVGVATGNAGIGYLVGGSLAGAVIGASVNDDTPKDSQ